MRVPLAHGRPWIQRARYLSAPLTRPLVTMRRLTARTLDGNPSSILVVDDDVPLKLLLAGMLAEQTETVPLGKVSIAALPAILRRETANYDLVLARVPQVLANWSFRTAFLRMPALVDMRVRAEEVAKRRQLGSSKTVGSAYARWRQQGFVAIQRREPADLNLFYETMYQPFVSARYGDAAALLSLPAMRRSLQQGTIVWVEKDGSAIAAQLIERCGSTLYTIAVGTSLEPAAARATGVLTALKVAASDLAIDTGCEWINFGGCMPWLSDGVLQNKRQWGAELVHRPWLHRGLLAAWARWTPAAAAFLALAPICCHDEMTFSITTAAPWAHRGVQNLTLPGINRVLMVDEGASGAGKDARGGIQRVTAAAASEILDQVKLGAEDLPIPESWGSADTVAS